LGRKNVLGERIYIDINSIKERGIGSALLLMIFLISVGTTS
jgi:hypothetical protein